MRNWDRKGYMVEEKEFDHDLHEFAVVALPGTRVIATIIPAGTEDMKKIVGDLDAGMEVDGWEDGMGNVITV